MPPEYPLSQQADSDEKDLPWLVLIAAVVVIGVVVAVLLLGQL